MTYKLNDWVLLSNGSGAYTVNRIVKVYNDREYGIAFGHYQVKCSEKELHKCPKSLIPKIIHGDSSSRG